MGPRRMGSSEADRRRCFQSDDEFQQHELLLRDLPCITAYYDAIMNNRRLFENKVLVFFDRADRLKNTKSPVDRSRRGFRNGNLEYVCCSSRC